MGEKPPPPPHVQKSILNDDTEQLSEFGKKGAEARNAMREKDRREAAEQEARWKEVDRLRAKQQAVEDRKRDAQIKKELDQNVALDPEGNIVHPHDLAA